MADRWRSGRRWQTIRQLVLIRDNYVCHLCGHAGATTADHVIPVALGGAPYDLANLKAACASCNRRKGAKLHKPIVTTRVW